MAGNGNAVAAPVQVLKDRPQDKTLKGRRGRGLEIEHLLSASECLRYLLGRALAVLGGLVILRLHLQHALKALRQRCFCLRFWMVGNRLIEGSNGRPKRI